jgi:UDP-glucose 4-epimerase
MRILVTGASGRIGGATVRCLRSAGHEVVGLDARLPTAVVPGTTFVQARLEDLTAGHPALDGIAAVAHLGALMSWDDVEAPRLFQANVEGTFRLLEAVAPLDLERFVFASTGEVYPEMAPAYLPIDEHHPRRPNSHYGLSKLLGEELVAFYARKHALPAATLRFCHVQDPVELLDPDSFFSGPRFFLRRRVERLRAAGADTLADELASAGQGDDTLIAVHGPDGRPARMCVLATTDMAWAITRAMTHPEIVGQTIGVGPDEPTDLAQLARDLGTASGLPVIDVRLPGVADYWTINARARELLGFRQTLTYADMVAAAASAYASRRATAPSTTMEAP